MTSPYVRRLRLAKELQALRIERGITTDDLSARVFLSRPKLSKIENALIRPDMGDLMNIIDALSVQGTEYGRLVRLARDASQRTWWDRYSTAMGARQRIYAELEAGCTTIHSYEQNSIPGALQTPEFIAGLIDLDKTGGTKLDYIPARMAEARMRRQRHMLGPDGPKFQVLLEEFVLYRTGVPREVMCAQIRSVLAIIESHPNIDIRVLPSTAPLMGGPLPRASFAIYGFADTLDRPIVAVDTVTTDLILSGDADVRGYSGQYDYLSKAAKSSHESIALLAAFADHLADGTEIPR